MATTPSTDNYTLGKGHLTFDQLISGAPSGELSLGNAPAFTFSLAIDKLDHFSSLGGLKAKDKTVITEISPTCTFTLDEMSSANINKLFMGTLTASTQIALVAGEATATTALGAVVAGQFYSLDHRQVGIYRAIYTEGAAGLAVGDVLTDTAATTTAVVQHIDTIASVKYVWFDTITGSGGFTLNGAWTTNGTGTGTFVGTPAVVDDIVLSDGVGTFVSGVGGAGDFTVNSEMGRIQITEASAMVLTAVVAYYVLKPATWNTINGLQTTSIEGLLRYVSDNPEGPNMELRMWKVSLTPDGDTAFIGDDWSTLAFTGEILKDAAGHPTNPYLEVIVST